jgi:hypothetical protein
LDAVSPENARSYNKRAGLKEQIRHSISEVVVCELVEVEGAQGIKSMEANVSLRFAAVQKIHQPPRGNPDEGPAGESGIQEKAGSRDIATQSPNSSNGCSHVPIGGSVSEESSKHEHPIVDDRSGQCPIIEITSVLILVSPKVPAMQSSSQSHQMPQQR